MSKGLLLLSEQLSHGQTGVTTFAVPVGRHMAPSFQVIVDCKMKGKHYGDSITVPIEEFTTYKVRWCYWFLRFSTNSYLFFSRIDL